MMASPVTAESATGSALATSERAHRVTSMTAHRVCRTLTGTLYHAPGIDSALCSWQTLRSCVG